MMDPEDLRTIEFIQKTNPSIKILAQYQKNLETELKDIIGDKDSDKKIKHSKGLKPFLYR